jgi:hypothetical protein
MSGHKRFRRIFWKPAPPSTRKKKKRIRSRETSDVIGSESKTKRGLQSMQLHQSTAVAAHESASVPEVDLRS